MNRKISKGFTLIELLIVVAIIAILAAIAVPNFLEAQMRSKVARVRTDMRTVAVALEAYFTDHNGYPQHRDFSSWPPPPNFRPWWAGITTPVAYITSMPKDPFAYPPARGISVGIGDCYHYQPFWNTWGNAGPNPPYDYMPDWWGPWPGFVQQMRTKGFWYVLESPGPDSHEDIQLNTKGMSAFYDPTNGAVSDGDICRFGPGASDCITF